MHLKKKAETAHKVSAPIPPMVMRMDVQCHRECNMHIVQMRGQRCNFAYGPMCACVLSLHACARGRIVQQ